MPEKASKTKVVVAVIQWEGQHYSSLCPLGSTVVAEPHHVDPMLPGPQGCAHHAEPVLVGLPQ